MEILTDRKKIISSLPVFATEEYMRARTDDYGWFLKDGFLLPFIIENKMLFKKMTFPNDTICLDNAATIEQENKFLAEVVEKAKEIGVHFIAQPPTNVVFRTFPEGSVFAPFGTYQVDLAQDPEALFANLHPKHRNVIRKAMKDGVTVCSGFDLWPQCYALIKQTFERQKLGFIGGEALKRMKESMGAQISFYLAEKQGVAQGAAVVFWNKLAAYYVYGGSIPNPSSGAVNLMHWQIMLDMKAKGSRTYDFVGARINPRAGSKQAGIQMFKERFGGKMKQGYLWKYPINKYYYGLYGLMRKMLGLESDIIDQEKIRP